MSESKYPIGFQHVANPTYNPKVWDNKFIDTEGSCGWQHFCFECGTEYCSGCTFTCPDCGSDKVSFKGWNPREIYSVIKEFPNNILYGTKEEQNPILEWNKTHPSYLEEGLGDEEE